MRFCPLQCLTKDTIVAVCEILDSSDDRMLERHYGPSAIKSFFKPTSGFRSLLAHLTLSFIGKQQQQQRASEALSLQTTLYFLSYVHSSNEPDEAASGHRW